MHFVVSDTFSLQWKSLIYSSHRRICVLFAVQVETQLLDWERRFGSSTGDRAEKRGIATTKTTNSSKQNNKAKIKYHYKNEKIYKGTGKKKHHQRTERSNHCTAQWLQRVWVSVSSACMRVRLSMPRTNLQPRAKQRTWPPRRPADPCCVNQKYSNIPRHGI